jgi:hypothetical protein
VVSDIHHMSNMWTAPNGKEYLVLPDGSLLLTDDINADLPPEYWTDQDWEDAERALGLCA